tara:strand:- start:1170 stop:1616 length:447 start_codon:yes stop_codon:yes gene_type:complete
MEEETKQEIKLNDLILDLKIISKIKPNNKLLIINDKLLIDDAYFLNGLIRYYKNQNRENTIEYIQNLNKNLEDEINKIILNKDVEDNILRDNPSNILVNLSHDLTQAVNGLKNLILTYNSDNFLVSKIEMIIYNFELKIRKICEILKI